MPVIPEGRREQISPRLSEGQLARLGKVGHRRKVEKGEVVIEQGQASPDSLVVPSGTMEIVQPGDGREMPITVHGRVASAVGEGSICVQLVHRVLAE